MHTKKILLLFVATSLLGGCNISTRTLFLAKDSKEVIEEDSGVQRLDLETLPFRTSYFEGEMFDPTGIEIYGISSGGNDIDIEVDELEYSKKPLLSGQESVKISYKNQSLQIPVVVKKGRRYEFEAEYSQVFGKTLISNDSSASQSGCLSEMSGYKGSGFCFTFNSSKSSYASLSFVLNGNTTEYDFGKNNEIQTVSSQGISKVKFSKSISPLNNWTEVLTCSIDVGVGLNKLFLTNNGGISSNIDKIILRTDSVITISNEEIVSPSLKIECEDMGIIGNCISDFEPGSNNPSGGKYIGAVYQTKGAGVRFIVKSDKTTSALLEMSIGREPSTWYDFDFFPSHKVSVDYTDGSKTSVISSGLTKVYKSTGSSWFDWIKTPICQVDLKEGYNIIRIENEAGGRSGNWDYAVLTPADQEANLKFFPSSRYEVEDGSLIGANAIQCYASITSSVTPESSNNPSGLGYVSGIDSKENSGYTYEVCAESDCTADMLLCVGLNESEYRFDLNHSITVEHEDKSSDDIIFNELTISPTNNTSKKGYDWKLFNIGSIVLKQGKNIIKVVHTTTSRSANHDYFMLAGDTEITSNLFKKYRFEAENATLSGDAVATTDTTKNASNDGFVVNCVSPSTVIFTINSTRNCTIKLNVCFGNKESSVLLSDCYSFKMSNSKVTKTVAPAFHIYAANDLEKADYEWAEYIIGEFQLIEGANTFTITAKKSSNHFIDYIDLYSSGVLS